MAILRDSKGRFYNTEKLAKDLKQAQKTSDDEQTRGVYYILALAVMLLIVCAILGFLYGKVG